jgi:hypothetical protein
VKDEEKAVLDKALVLDTEEGYAVHVIRKRTDPIATRISCGGGDAVAYCTYRGDLDEAIAILRNCVGALMELRREGREPAIAPDAGKQFA